MLTNSQRRQGNGHASSSSETGRRCPSSKARSLDRRTALKSIVATAGGLSLAGCSSLTGGGGDDTAEFSIAGINSGLAGLMTKTLTEQNFGEENDLNLSVEMGSVGAAIDLVVNRQVDAGAVPILTAGRLNTRDRPMRLMQPFYGLHHTCIAREGSDLNSIEDLQDITLGSLGEESSIYNTFYMLANEQGLEINDFDIRFSAPNVLVNSLRQGDLDAILLFDPIASQLLADDGFYEVFKTIDLWREVTGLSLASAEIGAYQDVIDENEEKTSRFTQAVLDTGSYINENLASVIQNNTDFFGLESDAAVDLAIERLDGMFPPFSDDVREGNKHAIELAGEVGIYEEGSVEDIDSIFLDM